MKNCPVVAATKLAYHYCHLTYLSPGPPDNQGLAGEGEESVCIGVYMHGCRESDMHGLGTGPCKQILNPVW